MILRLLAASFAGIAPALRGGGIGGIAPALRGGAMAVAIVLLAAGPAHAFCRLTTEMPTPGDNCAATGIGLTWRRACISFSMIERGTGVDFEAVRDVADVSFGTWMQVTCERGPIGLEIRQTVELGECAEPEYNPRGPNANTIIFIEDWSDRDLPADAFGLTLVWHNPDDGEIYDADMQINETLGALTVCGGVCPSGAVDLQNVITHEAGHFLGLGHTSERDATMSARASVGEISKRDLHEDDRAGLCSIYGDNPDPSCESSRYVPDNGFSAECWAGVEESSSSGGWCSAAAVGGAGRPFAAGALALFWLAVAARARARRRPAIRG
jgi:hypothetical protein